MAGAKAKNSDTIHLSAEGVWSQGGEEITHERTQELFFKSILFKNGKYFLTGEKSPVEIKVEDTPYFVRSIGREDEGYTVKLSDGTSEALDLATLDVGGGNALYCRVKGGGLRAKFERKVYYEITKDLEERDGFFGLNVGGVFYPIRRKEEPKKIEKQESKIVKEKTVAPKSGKKIAKAPAKKMAVKKSAVKKTVVKKPKPKKIVAKKTVKKKIIKTKSKPKSKKK